MILVTGNTSIGAVKGIWKHVDAPITDKTYHAELTIYNIAELDIHYDKKTPICISEQNTAIKGICEDIDEEVYDVRFESNRLEMIDIIAGL